MKLLFDQNLSHRLVDRLAAEFPGSVHVRQLGLASAADTIVWQYARDNDLMIISKDVDFQQRALVRGHPPKVVWLRIGNCTTTAIESLIRSRVADISDFAADPEAAFLALL